MRDESLLHHDSERFVGRARSMSMRLLPGKVLGAAAQRYSGLMELLKSNTVECGRPFGPKLFLGLGHFGSFCGHKPEHLLLQLRIHLVRDGHNVWKQRAEFQLLHILVQHCKNANL
jgi:hypothetical protein